MQYTTLGRTELKVSVAGLGCGGFSRLSLATGGTEASAIAIIHAALDLGVNILDTVRCRRTTPRASSAKPSNQCRVTRW